MTTQKTNASVADAIRRDRDDIANLTAWLELELDKQRDAAPTWGDVGALEHVRENLIETLAFFSGVEEAQIKRSLDELH
jgi:hypothetical protein